MVPARLPWLERRNESSPVQASIRTWPPAAWRSLGFEPAAPCPRSVTSLVPAEAAADPRARFPARLLPLPGSTTALGRRAGPNGPGRRRGTAARERRRSCAGCPLACRRSGRAWRPASGSRRRKRPDRRPGRDRRSGTGRRPAAEKIGPEPARVPAVVHSSCGRFGCGGRRTSSSRPSSTTGTPKEGSPDMNGSSFQSRVVWFGLPSVAHQAPLVPSGA